MPTCRRLAALGALLALAAAVTGCDGHRRYRDLEYWSVSIDNRTGITLDIYLDDGFAVTVTSGTTATVRGVVEDHHHLAAYDLQGRLRAERGFYLDRDFLWLLE